MKYNGKLHRFMAQFYELGFGACIVEFSLDDLIEMKTETEDPNIQHWLSQLCLNWGYAEEVYRIIDDEMIPGWVTEQDDNPAEEEPEPEGEYARESRRAGDEDAEERRFTDGLDEDGPDD